MGVKLGLCAALALGFAVACDNTPVGPTAPSPIPPPIEVPSIPPRVDQPFSWANYHGFSAFGLFAHDEATVDRTITEAMLHGWNTPRVCAETENWDDGAFTPIVLRDRIQLRLWLDHLARIPGVQVLLIANCTLKGPTDMVSQMAWAEAVAEVASDYPNVALEMVNEFDNCSGRGWGPYCPGKQDVRQMIEAARRRGVAEVSSDDAVCWGPDVPKTYEFRLWNIGATFADFHPCRTKGREPWDPPTNFLEQLVDRNRGMAVLSETVAFDDSDLECDSGLRTCDKGRIERAIAACAAVPGCKFTFHSMSGLRGADYSWWPQAR